MYGIKAIVSKELRRVFKDKKMIMSLFVLPVILVVGLARSIYAAYLDAYKQMLLGNRFGNYAAVEMFNVNDNTVQDEDKAAGKMLGTMLPYFITMLIFAGAMGLGVDMIAGEKERGTLATMLLSPVKREQIVLGKVFSLSILAVMSAAVYIISMVIALPMMIKNVGGADALDGMSVNFTGGQIAQMIILMIGVVLLYVSIICMVAVFAKNVKEASSYISPVYILVLVAGMITMYTSADGVFYKYLIPVYGSSMAFKDILTREITMTNFLGTTISTYLYAVIIVAVMTKAFNSEKVMFNA